MTDVKKISHPEISEIYVLPTKEEASIFSAQKISEVVNKNRLARITFATGNSQILVYKNASNMCKQGSVSFSEVTAFHLDEYYPCGPDNPFGFVNYLNKHVFIPFGIPKDQINVINGLADDPQLEADRYESLLAEKPIDLAILGIGPGGHIAFCESGTPFSSKTRLIDLSEETVHRDLVERGQDSPKQAITQGISTILSSKKIILNAFDRYHGEIMKKVLYGPISEFVPGSSLRSVGEKVLVILDREASGALI